MDALTNARFTAIENSRLSILRNAKNTNSQLIATTDKVVQFAGLIFNSVLTGSADFTPNSAELVIGQFELERLKVEAQLTKLNDIAGIRKLMPDGLTLDPVATQTAFTTYVTKYGLNLVDISKTYDPI